MLRLRPVQEADEELLWHWANDADIRAWSWSTASIPWPEHREWFRRRMADAGCHFFVGEVEGVAIGQIRFDLLDDAARVGVSVAPGQQGRGYGVELIRQGTSLFFQTTDVVRVVAEVKSNNAASRRAFLRAGYALVGDDEAVATFVAVVGRRGG